MQSQASAVAVGAQTCVVCICSGVGRGVCRLLRILGFGEKNIDRDARANVSSHTEQIQGLDVTAHVMGRLNLP